MIALIDSDIVAHRCAATAENTHYAVKVDNEIYLFKYHKLAKACCLENGIDVSRIETRVNPEPVENCLHSVKLQIQNIIESSGASEYKLYLSGKNNFRKQEYSDYKANRKDLVPPTHLQAAKDYMVERWDAVIADGMEADDMLGIEASKDPENSVICSLDKDLNQISCWHYDWVSDRKYWVTPAEAYRFTWEQMLQGDRVDNIIGLHGIGPVKARRILEDVLPEDFECVVGLHYAIEFDDPEEMFIKNKRLLTILTEMPDGRDTK